MLDDPDGNLRYGTAYFFWNTRLSEATIPLLIEILTSDNTASRRLIAATYPQNKPGFNTDNLVAQLKAQLPESLDGIIPGHQLYEAAWLYATLSTKVQLQ